MKILNKLKFSKWVLSTIPVTTAITPKNMTKEQAIAYVTQSTGYYKTVKSDYRDDAWDEGVYEKYVPPLGNMDKKWRKDKDVVLAAVLNDYRSFDYASDKLKKDVDIINAYNQRNVSNIGQSKTSNSEEIRQVTNTNNYTDVVVPITLEEHEDKTISEDPVITNSVQPKDVSVSKKVEQQFQEYDDLEKTAMEWSEHKRKLR